jgi:signal transduction histidine kinase
VSVTGALHQFVDDSASQLKEKYWPGQAGAQEDAWPLVTSMIQQTLELNRMVFLEATAGGTILRQISAWNCTADDLIDAPKDCAQRPYLDAINARGPLKIKDLFKDVGSDEVQYLAPLSFWGELLGFWGLGADVGKTGGLQHFEGMLREYTKRVGEVLYHWRQCGAMQDANGVGVRQLMKRSSEAAAQALRSTLGLLHARLGSLDVLIHRLGTGVIVYDVFGRVLQVNEVMVDLLRKEGLSPFGMNALDLILAVSDLDITKSRKVLQRVILNNEAVSFQGRLHSAFGKRYTIYLKPLLDESSKKEVGSSEPKIPRSILCEVLDTTSVSRAIDMKTRLTGRLGFRIRHDLAAIDLCSELLERGEFPADERHRIRKIVSGKVQASVGALTECQQYLAVGTEGEELDRFPVDPKTALAAAVDGTKDDARKRGVSLECKEPYFVSYVFGSAPRLEQLFKSILEILLKDSAENSSVIIRMTESEDIVAFDFSNKGFGIPNDLFQEYIFGLQEGTSEEFKKLREGIKWVEAWGGVIDAASGVGVGMHFTLHLVKFM